MRYIYFKIKHLQNPITYIIIKNKLNLFFSSLTANRKLLRKIISFYKEYHTYPKNLYTRIKKYYLIIAAKTYKEFDSFERLCFPQKIPTIEAKIKGNIMRSIIVIEPVLMGNFR